MNHKQIVYWIKLCETVRATVLHRGRVCVRSASQPAEDKIRLCVCDSARSITPHTPRRCSQM